MSATDTASVPPAEQLADYVTEARKSLDEISNSPAPCGHDSCAEKDRKIIAAAQQHAGDILDHITSLEADPIAAAKVFALLDSQYIAPTIAYADPDSYPTIPAWELHYLLMAALVALYDHAALAATSTEGK